MNINKTISIVVGMNSAEIRRLFTRLANWRRQWEYHRGGHPHIRLEAEKVHEYIDELLNQAYQLGLKEGEDKRCQG